jgi:glyoxylase-like metal-dependent hydrolase (beta-lactamase superfamily II)
MLWRRTQEKDTTPERMTTTTQRQFLVWILLFVIVTPACERPLRPAYVPPTLADWPSPYHGVAGLRLHIFKTGEVRTSKKVVYRGGSLLDMLVLAEMTFAIEHPRRDIILVGTGLSRGVVHGSESYLGGFRTAVGSPKMSEGQDILSQLEAAGLQEKKVRTIILPDLRFSHTGELENFPTAQVVVSSKEYATAMEEEETALSLTDEYDGVTNWQFIDFAEAKPLGTFRAHRDLFGDGSVLLIDVTGATPGGIAVLIRLPQAPVLLCGNLGWTTDNIQYVREPGFLFDRKSWWDNAWRLKKFKELAPELVVLPAHEWKTIEAARTTDMIFHRFPASSKDQSAKKKEAPPSLRQKNSEKKKDKREVHREKR